MQVTLELPDNIQALPPEKQKDNVLRALHNVLDVKTKIAQSVDKLSRWAKIAERVENDEIHLKGYSKQLKRDIKEFRNNFEFKHDK